MEFIRFAGTINTHEEKKVAKATVNVILEDCTGTFYITDDSFDFISDGVDAGVEIGGTLLGIPGAIVGAVLGGFVGCVKSILDDIF